MFSPFQTRLKALATMLEEAEDRLDQVERQRKARLEALTSTASQVNNNNSKKTLTAGEPAYDRGCSWTELPQS